MIMNDDLLLTQNKEAVLAQIDALHEQHRLIKLRELVDSHNNNLVERIEYTDETPVYELILQLWDRHLTIPEMLTFGEPYDSCFFSWHGYHSAIAHYVTDVHRMRDLIGLFRYAHMIPMFIVYRIHFGNWTHHLSTIWPKVSSLSQGESIIDTRAFQRRIMHQKIPVIDLVYLMVLLDRQYSYTIQSFLDIATL